MEIFGGFEFDEVFELPVLWFWCFICSCKLQLCDLMCGPYKTCKQCITLDEYMVPYDVLVMINMMRQRPLDILHLFAKNSMRFWSFLYGVVLVFYLMFRLYKTRDSV